MRQNRASLFLKRYLVQDYILIPHLSLYSNVLRSDDKLKNRRPKGGGPVQFNSRTWSILDLRIKIGFKNAYLVMRIPEIQVDCIFWKQFSDKVVKRNLTRSGRLFSVMTYLTRASQRPVATLRN